MAISFGIQKDHFIRNGEPHRILSGALHYFRIPPAYWEDRLLKCRACGLNTVETYVAWNFHEPKKGEFKFEGWADLRGFIQLAAKLGLDVILRPGPYICAEWEFGGFPAWLLADSSMRLRCMDEAYLGHVSDFFIRLFAEVGDLQCTQGGPIIAVQVENEYGSYGTDRNYLTWVENTLRQNGVEVLLFTSDGPEDSMLQGGTLPHIFKTVNFGSNAKQAFAKLREYQPIGPLMCMEFWNGWFDHWGQPHNVRSAADAAKELDELLACGASVNIYMMHGGTNFGFWNGANFFDDYRPTVTSYDYDAPLDEQGNPTLKYELFREVLQKHGAQVESLPERSAAVKFTNATVEASASLFTQLGNLTKSIFRPTPITMEEAGQNYGYILYRHQLSGPRPLSKLFLQQVRDRAHIYFAGKLLGIVDRNEGQKGLEIEVPAEGGALEVLVENLGRTNYGPGLRDPKGITEGIRLNYQFLHGWEIYPLEFSSFDQVAWELPFTDGRAMIHQATFEVDQPEDTFVKIEGGKHGAVWINGFALGRYWELGPQRSLFLPGPLFQSGRNTLIILETESNVLPQVSFSNRAELG